MSPKRVIALIFIAFLLAGGLTVRLFSVAVAQHSFYLAKADNQQVTELDILARRGDIFVQDASVGQPSLIATSVERFAISATPRNVQHKPEYAHLLAQVTGQDEGDILTTFKKDGVYMSPLKHALTHQQVETIAIQINQLETTFDRKHKNISVNFDTTQGTILSFLGGVFFQQEYQRVYTEGPLLAQVLGFVNNHGKGQYGIEEQYDSGLKGYDGKLSVEQDSIGNLLDQSNAIEGKDGVNYELSIDRTVQFVAERELASQIKDSEATGGSVIIMNPKNGEVIAMANQPSYDPNNYAEVSQKDISVFDNPSISNIWEPGSIFKPLVMAAAMDLNLVTPDTKSTFPESVTVEGHVIETALRKAYGEETMTQVLANSDNVAMVWVANKLGNQSMYDYLKKFGFGEFTGIDLRHELAGSILAQSQWRDINRATISFGQGIATTPMQIVSAYAAIANNGRLVQPHVVHAIIGTDGKRQVVQPVFGAQVVKPEMAQQLKMMMVATVQSAHNRAGTPGYKIGGKTGTAQIPDPVNGGYIPDAYNHSFMGIGPSDDPKYVMLVKIDHPNLKKVGLYAESTAVPLFGRISSFLLNYYQIPPTEPIPAATPTPAPSPTPTPSPSPVASPKQ